MILKIAPCRKNFYFSQTMRLLFDSFGFMLQGWTFVVIVNQRMVGVLKAIFPFFLIVINF